ncbi:MAG: hypothetical protein FJ116_12275 [Deltaproteobacteria bacterium]|nr:hypothetical protein [Deltaproteobacteria bacterium]
MQNWLKENVLATLSYLLIYSSIVLGEPFAEGLVPASQRNFSVIESISGEFVETLISADTSIFRVQQPKFPLLPYKSTSFQRDPHSFIKTFYDTQQIYFGTNEATLTELRRVQGYFEEGATMYERKLGEYISDLENKGYTRIRIVRDTVYDFSVAGGKKREGLIIVADPPPASPNTLRPIPTGSKTCLRTLNLAGSALKNMGVKALPIVGAGIQAYMAMDPQEKLTIIFSIENRREPNLLERAEITAAAILVGYLPNVEGPLNRRFKAAMGRYNEMLQANDRLIRSRLPRGGGGCARPVPSIDPEEQLERDRARLQALLNQGGF